MIAAIHQSRSDLFPRFGSVLLLAKGGQVAYSGRGGNMLQYFASLGHTCPSTTNPADFALDIVSIDLREEGNEKISREKVQNLIQQFSATQQSEKLAVQNEPKAEELGLVGLEGKDYTPMYVAMPILLRRGLLCFKRRPDLAAARIMQVVGLGFFIALFFAPLKTDYPSFQNRLGVVQQLMSSEPLFLFPQYWWYGSLPEDKYILLACCRTLASTHWNEMSFTGYGRAGFVGPLVYLLIPLQEYADRTYSVNSFFFVYLILEIPFEIASSLLFSLLLVAVDLQRSVSMCFLIALVSFSMVNCGESLGIIFNTLINDSTGFALSITNTLISIGTIMAGERFLYCYRVSSLRWRSLGILSIDMPAFFKGINYISPGKYAVAAVSIQTFTDFEFTCTDAQRLPDGSCPIQTGQQVLDLFNYHTSLASNIGALVAVTVGYRLIAYAVLRLAKTDFGIVRKGPGPRLEKVEVDN